jgi:transcriptional regulator with XRE-family HTH domain
MADSETEVQYKQAFIERVRAARIAANLKQWQIADALGMPQDKYKQYESRSLLPHYLIGRFCILTRVDPEWLITGRGQKPLKPMHIAGGAEPTAKPKRKGAKRAA